MPKQLPLKDTPLSATIEHNQLVIRIGVDTLAFADEQRYESHETLGQHRIVNPRRFAEDVTHAMTREEEDGSSPLTVFLDKMMEDAIQEGSMWVEERKADALREQIEGYNVFVS